MRSWYIRNVVKAYFDFANNSNVVAYITDDDFTNASLADVRTAINHASAESLAFYIQRGIIPFKNGMLHCYCESMGW